MLSISVAVKKSGSSFRSKDLISGFFNNREQIRSSSFGNEKGSSILISFKSKAPFRESEYFCGGGGGHLCSAGSENFGLHASVFFCENLGWWFFLYTSGVLGLC